MKKVLLFGLFIFLLFSEMSDAFNGYFNLMCGKEDKYLGGTSQFLGEISYCSKGLHLKEGRLWSFDIENDKYDLSNDVTNILRLTEERTKESFSFFIPRKEKKELPNIRLTQNYLSMRNGFDNSFSKHTLYLNYYMRPYYSRYYEKIAVGREWDSEGSYLNATYLSRNVGLIYFYAGASQHNSVFKRAGLERKDYRLAGAVSLEPYQKGQHLILGYGNDFRHSSYLIGAGGQFFDKKNDWILAWRERVRRDSKDKPRKTQFLLNSFSFGGKGFDLHSLDGFFPGLLGTSQVISNIDISGGNGHSSSSLDRAKLSLIFTMLRVELTNTASVLMHDTRVHYKIAESAWWVLNPYVGIITTNQNDIFFDLERRQLSDSYGRSLKLVLGGGVELWKKIWAVELMPEYNLDQKEFSGISLGLSMRF